MRLLAPTSVADDAVDVVVVVVADDVGGFVGVHNVGSLR